MARVVRILGRGGQSFVERVFGWNRGMVRKGESELQSGEAIQDGFHRRGRRRAEEHLPNLLEDIRSIGPNGPYIQEFTNLFFFERKRGAFPANPRDYGYTDKELPVVRTLQNKLNELGVALIFVGQRSRGGVSLLASWTASRRGTANGRQARRCLSFFHLKTNFDERRRF